MAPHFLRDMPREIRDKVYHYVLVSPTGSAGLFAVTPVWAGTDQTPSTRFYIRSVDPRHQCVKKFYQGNINLSLLLVNKQIHSETRDIFWKHNAFFAGCPSHLLHEFQGLERSLAMRIERVVLWLDVLSRGDLKCLRKVLITLGTWQRDGKLKSVTFQLLSQSRKAQGVKAIERLLEAKAKDFVGCPFLEYMDILRDAKEGSLAHLDRKLAVDTTWYEWAPADRRIWRQGVVGDVGVLFKDLHDAFGGELWVDGVVCWRNHVQISEPLSMPTQEELDTKWTGRSKWVIRPGDRTCLPRCLCNAEHI